MNRIAMLMLDEKIHYSCGLSLQHLILTFRLLQFLEVLTSSPAVGSSRREKIKAAAPSSAPEKGLMDMTISDFSFRTPKRMGSTDTVGTARGTGGRRASDDRKYLDESFSPANTGGDTGDRLIKDISTKIAS